MQAKLQKFTLPLGWYEIQWKVQSHTNGKKYTIIVPYIDNRAVQNRLDKVFGAFNWSCEFTPIQNKEGYAVKCRLSIKNGDEWVSKEDGADYTNIEGTKGGISDAMKRVAVQWGLGRELYTFPKVMAQGEVKFIKPELEKEIQQKVQEQLDTDYPKDVVFVGMDYSQNTPNDAPKRV